MAAAKPKLTINLGETESLHGLPVLEVDTSTTYHKRYDLRPPLGVYNVSVAQIGQRLSHCSYVLEKLARAHTTPSTFSADPDNQTLSDYLLLAFYAAAEHVDDLESVLLTFFPNRKLFAKSAVVRRFKDDLRKVRRRMTGFANAVKHQQARIRTYLLGFEHDSRPMCLPGFFIEGVHDEVVGPSKIFHHEEKIISLPSILWETLVFVYECAALLERAVVQIRDTQISPTSEWSDLPSQPTLALTRIPNFSFEGQHPFERTTLVIQNADWDEGHGPPLYGSLFAPWSLSQQHSIGQTMGSFAGDGVTRSFQIVDPSQVRLQHWG